MRQEEDVSERPTIGSEPNGIQGLTAGSVNQGIPAKADQRFGRRLIAPGILLMTLLVAFPTVVALYISLTAWSPTSGLTWYDAHESWIWFDNYAEAFSGRSLSILLRTTIITVVAVGLEFALGFVLALLFVEGFPGHRVVTVLVLLPMMVVPAVAGFVFFLLLESSGPINIILGGVVPGDVQIGWLTDPDWTPVSVILVDVWQWTPLMFLILVAGMLAVPDDQQNAARLLGASWFQRLRTLTLPLLKPIIIIALIIRAMEAFKIFDASWLLTQGGPGESSSTISVALYREAFINARWSYTAAVGILVMILVSIIAFQAVKPIERAQREA